jgi:methylmalonyl-CoA mutase
MVKKEKLFEQFPPVTTKEWMAKIGCDLKGADFNKKLVWKTNEGFDVMPFYRMEDTENLMYINSLPGDFPFIRGKKVRDNSWKVRQNLEVSDYAEANLKALDILMKGIDSLGFVITDPESVNEDNFKKLLRNIHIELIEINFLCNGKAKEILSIISIISGERGIKPSAINGAIEADPLGRLMSKGTLCVSVETGFEYLASLTESASLFSNLRTIHLNGSDFNNAGADIVMELGLAISMGNEYLSQLTERGLNPEPAASKIRFSFGTGSNYFSEIAKLRAARLLWSVVQKGYNNEEGGAVEMDIHSITTRWNKTVYDPYVNMLRTQTEAMSAILGGADSLTVEPFDIAFRQSDEFSERIARNQQLILKEEAYFDKVADPAAGSYYIENLTALIAENSWKLFLEIEEAGGFLAALKSGLIQRKLSESAQNRKKDIATRKMTLLGTNQYPNNSESLSSSVDPEIVYAKQTTEEELIVDPIIKFRASEEYEKLRIAVDKAEKRPAVFLMPLGNTVMRKARAQFSAGFFGCAGYNVIDNHGYENAEAGINAAAGSGADIVVICSSDEEYMLYTPEIYSNLKDKAFIVVAGNPASAEELKSLGIQYFIHMKSNVPQILQDFNNKLGIKL